MAFHSVPHWIQRIYPSRTWKIDTEEKEIFLTFDDGPVPGATDYVLDQLALNGIKATFFMVGDNVRKYPALAKRVKDEGHALGNHTFNHFNGWKTSVSDYLDNFSRCQEIIEDVLDVSPKVFRPPYGLMKSSQARLIQEKVKITMWDVLSGDYQKGILSNQVVEKVNSLSKEGSILLFHDQQKTEGILPKVLPKSIEGLLLKGFKFGLL